MYYNDNRCPNQLYNNSNNKFTSSSGHTLKRRREWHVEKGRRKVLKVLFKEATLISRKGRSNKIMPSTPSFTTRPGIVNRLHASSDILPRMRTRLQPMHTKLPLILLFLSCLCFGYAHAVAECTSGNSLSCFHCNSHVDPFCADPFNWTTLPPVKECDGCCVKIVQHIDTPNWKVRRGCTDNLDINMFMVDHVCMSEGGGKGKMCFCEDDECNAATRPSAGPSAATAIISTLLFLLHHTSD